MIMSAAVMELKKEVNALNEKQISLVLDLSRILNLK